MNSILVRHMVTGGIVLLLFAAVGIALVSITFDRTWLRIKANERAALLRSLHAIIPPSLYDNEIVNDTIRVVAPGHLGTSKPMTVYRARHKGNPRAVAIEAVAPDGYNGSIRLLIGIAYDGTLTGVRVVAHQETPGLGDAIEARRSDWILVFDGPSLDNPEKENWQVKRDGGVFDQFTGATITPRAVVKAVYKCLEYFAIHKDDLFTPRSQEAQ